MAIMAIINMSSPVAPTPPLSIDKVPRALYEKYQDIFDTATASRYLLGGHDVRLLTIVQLALGTSPYTEVHEVTFRAAQKARGLSHLCLGLGGYTAINLIPGIFAVLGSLDWEITIMGYPIPKLVISNIFNCTGIFVADSLGMLFTGSIPKRKSNADIDAQNALVALEKRFDECAKYMIHRYKRGEPDLPHSP